MTTTSLPYSADLHERWATEPPERRGIRRDQVRLIVARPDGIEHLRFADIGDVLHPGDLLVVNTSSTRAAAVDGSVGGRRVVVHVATRLSATTSIVELRQPDGSGPVLDAVVDDIVTIGEDGEQITLRLCAPHAAGPAANGIRLWLTDTDADLDCFLDRHGRPITYGATGRFPLSAYQTVFARDPASAEIPSAARPFSVELVTSLVSVGVRFAPITLHTGVSSQELGEPPQTEWFQVPQTTADLVADTRRRGGRVVAVGTTATRALESAVVDGRVVATEGWTDHVVTPDIGVAVVDGLISGWHETGASHLQLLEAVAGRDLIDAAYSAALAGPYLWHEFGDSCLLLP